MSSNQILSTLDALAVATFMDIGRQVDKNGDVACAETYYKRAVRAAETIYGALHGEVGLVLMQLSEFYRRQGRLDDAAFLEARVGEITEVYKTDQLN